MASVRDVAEMPDEYTAEEAAQRRDAVIRHMLSKPPEPRKKPQSRTVKRAESSQKKG